MLSLPLRCLRFVIGLAICIFLVIELDPRDQLKKPGQVDLLEYWAAAKLISNSENPYNAHRIAELQAAEPTTGRTLPAPILMWNPPFVVPLISFMGDLDFESARVFWSFLALAASFVAICLLITIERLQISWRLLLALMTFFPLMSVLQFGQISWVLILSLALALFFLRQRKIWLAGLSLSLCLIKPHLLYLVYLSCFFVTPAEQRVRLVVGFVAGALIMAGWAELLAPGVWGQWIEAFGRPPTDFLTPTLGSLLQLTLRTQYDLLLYLPAIVSLVLILIFRNQKLCQDILKDPVSIAALSLATAPYGWVFDQVVLMPLVFRLSSAKDKAWSYAVIALNIFGFSPWFPALHHYWWYPLALFCVAVIYIRKAPKKSEPLT